jgi:hypothetical protein
LAPSHEKERQPGEGSRINRRDQRVEIFSLKGNEGYGIVKIELAAKLFDFQEPATIASNAIGGLCRVSIHRSRYPLLAPSHVLEQDGTARVIQAPELEHAGELISVN